MKPPPAPLIASFLLLTAMIAGWFAWQQGPTGGALFAGGKKELAPPAKTRHSQRVEPAAPTVDALADYKARSEKGMTDQQIGWILEDFQNAGLEPPARITMVSVEDSVKLRAAQQRWYRDTLVVGLRLTPEQSAQVTAKLALLLESANEEYHAWLLKISRDANGFVPEPLLTVNWGDPFVHANRWLDSEGMKQYGPAKLCELRPEQLEILRQPEPEVTAESAPIFVPDLVAIPLDRPVQVVPAEPLPMGYPDAFSVFPARSGTAGFTMTESDFLPMIRKMHPAQLRMLVLLDPWQAGHIRTALDAAAAAAK